VLRCEKWRAPEAEPRGRRAKASSKQRRAARLCMDFYTHSTTLFSRSLSFVATPPPPPPVPSRFPSKRGAALPSFLAPFFESLPLQTNKQQQEFRLQKRPVLFVALSLFEKLKARRSKLPCLSESLDLMRLARQRTLAMPCVCRQRQRPPLGGTTAWRKCCSTAYCELGAMVPHRRAFALIGSHSSCFSGLASSTDLLSSCLLMEELVRHPHVRSQICGGLAPAF
jgi:hypothetical protein